MSLPWRSAERAQIDAAVRRFPAESGKCAALARVVFEVAKPGDPGAAGLQVRPRGTARYIQTKHPSVHFWNSHTLVRTREHHVDALTGADGCEQDKYLDKHLAYPEFLTLHLVDVTTVDPGVQHDGE